MDKSTIAWIVAYAYLAYVFIGQLPDLSSTLLFSLRASSVLLVVLYLFHSYLDFGWKNASKYLAVVFVVSYAVEFLGTKTGIHFGRYRYTGGLAPLLGPVPLIIPFLWASLGYFSLAAAGNYLVASVLMVLLDVSFDPRFSLSLWHWAVPGQYFGVPLSNFVGWFVTSLALFGVFYLASRKRFEPSAPAIGFYFLLGVNNVIVDANSGLGVAGEISLILFASASVLLYVARRRHPVSPAKARPPEVTN